LESLNGELRPEKNKISQVEMSPFNIHADIRSDIVEIADISARLSVSGYLRLPTDISVEESW